MKPWRGTGSLIDREIRKAGAHLRMYLLSCVHLVQLMVAKIYEMYVSGK